MNDREDSKTSAGSAEIPDVTPPPSEVLEIDYVYEALAHSRRRYLCYTLLEETEWTLDELARKIAAWENDSPEDEITNRQQQRIYLSLYHSHIPKLADIGVLSFDDTTETITTAPNAKQVLLALEGMGASLDANQETHARGG
jgi:hypothetical protein